MPMNLQQLQAAIANQQANPNVIYNKYQRSDHNVGQDNLNPQREINLSDAEMWADIENMRARLYSLYRERLERLRAAQGTGARVPDDLGLPYDDQVQLTVPVSLQETGAGRGIGRSPERDVEEVIGALSGLLGGDLVTIGDLPFDVCENVVDGNNQTDPSAEFDGSGLPSAEELAAAGAGPGAESAASDAGAGSGAGGDGSAGGDGVGGAEGFPGSEDELVCFTQEIALLQILLTIIQIVQTAARIQQMVLSVVFAAVRAATLIAQAWVNPASIAELVQELANMGVSFLMEAIMTFVQFIWDSLDLDCLLKTSLSTIRGIMGNIGGVQDAGSEAATFLQLNNRAITDVTSAGVRIRDAFRSKTLEEAVQEQINNATHGGSNADSFIEGAAIAAGGYVSNSPALAALNNMDAVRKVKSAKASLARAYTSTVDGSLDIKNDILEEMGQTATHAATGMSAVARAEARARRERAEELNNQAARGYRHTTDSDGNEITVQLSEAEREQLRRQAADERAAAEAEEARAQNIEEAEERISNTVDNITGEANQTQEVGDTASGADRTATQRRVNFLRTLNFKAVEGY